MQTVPKLSYKLEEPFYMTRFPELESKALILPWRIGSKDKECQNQSDLLDWSLMDKDHGQ